MRRRNSSAACKRVLASRSRWPHPCVLPPKLGSADRLLSFGSIASEPGSRLRVHRYRRIAGQRESRGPSSAGSRTEQEQTDLARAGSVQNQPRAFVSRSVEARADLGPLPLERGAGSFTQPHQRARCRGQRAERSAGTPVGRNALAQRGARVLEQRVQHHSDGEREGECVRRCRPERAEPRSAETSRVSSTDRRVRGTLVRRTSIE